MVVSLGVFASWREAAARAVVRFSPNPLSASPREPAIVAVVRFSPNPLSAFSAVKAVTVFPCGPRAKDYDVGMPRIETGHAPPEVWRGTQTWYPRNPKERAIRNAVMCSTK